MASLTHCRVTGEKVRPCWTVLLRDFGVTCADSQTSCYPVHGTGLNLCLQRLYCPVFLNVATHIILQRPKRLVLLLSSYLTREDVRGLAGSVTCLGHLVDPGRSGIHIGNAAVRSASLNPTGRKGAGCGCPAVSAGNLFGLSGPRGGRVR